MRVWITRAWRHPGIWIVIMVVWLLFLFEHFTIHGQTERHHIIWNVGFLTCVELQLRRTWGIKAAFEKISLAIALQTIVVSTLAFFFLQAQMWVVLAMISIAVGRSIMDFVVYRGLHLVERRAIPKSVDILSAVIESCIFAGIAYSINNYVEFFPAFFAGRVIGGYIWFLLQREGGDGIRRAETSTLSVQRRS